jgi:hypothetical protein
MMAGFRRGAMVKTGLFCASEEEDFAEATMKGGEGGATTTAGFGKAAVSPMGASTRQRLQPR